MHFIDKVKVGKIGTLLIAVAIFLYLIPRGHSIGPIVMLGLALSAAKTTSIARGATIRLLVSMLFVVVLFLISNTFHADSIGELDKPMKVLILVFFLWALIWRNGCYSIEKNQLQLFLGAVFLVVFVRAIIDVHFFDKHLGSYANQIQYGINLAAAVVTTSAVAVHADMEKSKGVFLILVIVLFYMLTLTESKTAVLSAISGIGFQVVFLKKSPSRMSAGLIMLMAVLVIGFLSGDMRGRWSALENDIAQNQSNVGTWSSRQQMFHFAWEQFTKEPVFGVGQDGYERAIKSDERVDIVNRGYSNPHNDVLNLLAKFGILGFLAYVILFASLWIFYAAIATESFFASLIGRSILVTYCVAGVAQGALTHNSGMMAFLFFNMLAIAAYRFESKESVKNI